jgi:hypothetical protein
MQRLLKVANWTTLGLCGAGVACYGIRTVDATVNGYTKIQMQLNGTDSLSQGLSPFLGSVVTVKDEQGKLKYEEWHFRPTVYEIEILEPSRIQIQA